MLNFLDNFLDRITMYQLTLYVLIGLLAVAMLLGHNILLSSILLVVVCWITNKFLALLFHAPSNVESTYITALILALIISPIKSVQDVPFLVVAGVLAIASKYILAIHKKHIFNPAAISVVLTAFIFHWYASWWVGTPALLPFVALGGFLIVRKIQKIQVVVYFLLAATLLTPVRYINFLFLDSSIVFFATIMLIEPLTFPPKQMWQYVYLGIVAILMSPYLHVGNIALTPELALIIGNIFSYLVSPKGKYMLQLIAKKQSTDGIGEFIFSTKEKLHFLPGQYMEWTLQHSHTDSRGNRRYFTLASSPTEANPQLGVRFYPQQSSFKNALSTLPIGATIAAGNLSGEFVLPKNLSKKLVFLAGGIGITPFRSMVKYCLDTNTRVDIVLLYLNKTQEEVCYDDIFQQAKKIGLQTQYIFNEKKILSVGDIKKFVPDFPERIFYISGSHTFVVNAEKTLHELSIGSRHMKKDFFPGLV